MGAQREICVGVGQEYRVCDMLFHSPMHDYMLVRDKTGQEYIARQGMGTWCAMTPMDVIGRLQLQDSTLKSANIEIAAMREKVQQTLTAKAYTSQADTLVL